MKPKHQVTVSLLLVIAIVAGAFAIYQALGWTSAPPGAIAEKRAGLVRAALPPGTIPR